MKSALWILAGCFVATFGPVTANHLLDRADLSELVDAAVSTLMFTLAFGMGLALARRLTRAFQEQQLRRETRGRRNRPCNRIRPVRH